MPQTINKTFQGQIIGGIFSSRDNADKAIRAFKEFGISEENMQVVVKLNNKGAEDTYTSLWVKRGFSESQALYYNKVVHEGKVLVAVYEVTDAAPIIDIFDRYGAEYNPNGSRNLREDVMVMTTGVVVGAAVGGIAGVLIGGPAGATAGVVAGAVLGGGSGAVAGKSAEHNK